MNWNIQSDAASPVLRFAAEEFERLMGRMDAACGGTLTLRVGGGAPAVRNPQLDDGYTICADKGRISIDGCNERSVLMGVYRLFREAGCAFVRPGRDGEYVPARDMRGFTLNLTDTPAYRNRGVCIEGADTYENVAEMIDFLPKLGFNAFFTQFFRPYDFFDRWYNHTSNPELTPTRLSPETIDAFCADYNQEILRRGLLHHSVGHGWTAACLGLDANGWYTVPDSSVPPERRNLIAQINGERHLFEKHGKAGCGVAIDTNLCYSDPTASQAMVDAITDYCLAHPEKDYVHIWLADARNNQCECEHCRDELPADLYIEILNRVDARLTAAGCPTRLVFLLYLELLWPPKHARFANPDRFTLMFAPITRTYSQCYGTTAVGHMAPFTRNQIQLPRSVEDTLAYLRAWQEIFSGDSFVYDYHYVWDQYHDLGGVQLASVLAQDIENYRRIGLNGLMSCQAMRCHLPTGLGQCVMGDALWRGKLDFEVYKHEYFMDAFGPDGALAQSFCEQLSLLGQPEYCRNERPAVDPEAAAKFAEIPNLIERTLPLLRAHADDPESVHADSWFYLAEYCAILRPLAQTLHARAAGDTEKMWACWQTTKHMVQTHERRLQPVFEAFFCLQTLERMLGSQLLMS